MALCPPRMASRRRELRVGQVGVVQRGPRGETASFREQTAVSGNALQPPGKVWRDEGIPASRALHSAPGRRVRLLFCAIRLGGHSISSHSSGNGSLRSKSRFAGLTRTATKWDSSFFFMPLRFSCRCAKGGSFEEPRTTACAACALLRNRAQRTRFGPAGWARSSPFGAGPARPVRF